VAGLSGNEAIENAAIEWVMGLERAAGRKPRDTRYLGAPTDIESPPRLIEVKSFGTSNRGYDLWLEVRQVQEAKANPEFYVYVVENVRQGDPGQFMLRVLCGDRLRRLLERAKEQRYYTVPWPVSDYDNCPGLDGLS
jgi:Protein NO VEIN, C-terminal